MGLEAVGRSRWVGTALAGCERGRATIDGLDVVRHAPVVRRVISFTGQYAVDPHLTGFESLRMVACLHHMDGFDAASRARELLMVLGLDEPTTGLDLTSGMGMWTATRELVDEGTTVVLATEYLARSKRPISSVTSW